MSRGPSVRQLLRVGSAAAARRIEAVNAILGNWRLSGIIHAAVGAAVQHRRLEQLHGRSRLGARGPGRDRLPGARSGPLRRARNWTRISTRRALRIRRRTPTARWGETFWSDRASPTSIRRWRKVGDCRSSVKAGLIEYRFEAFNVLNATHLANPVTGLTNPNFGKITGRMAIRESYRWRSKSPGRQARDIALRGFARQHRTRLFQFRTLRRIHLRVTEVKALQRLNDCLGRQPAA